MAWDSIKKKYKALNVQSLSLGALDAFTPVTASAADLNLLAGLAGAGLRLQKIVRLPLAAANTAGGSFAWANPEATPVIVDEVILRVLTVTSGAGAISVGVAANGTTAAANIIDTLDLSVTPTLYFNYEYHGTLGTALVREIPVGGFVTGSKATGSLAGLTGFVYLRYFLV